MYSYQSNPRLQLFFDSPNQLATILGMATLLAGGALAWCFDKYPVPNGRRRFALILLTTLGSISSLFLVQTYSRGGWVAFIAGLSLLFFSIKKHRRVSFFLLTVFVVFSFIIPNATDRAGSTLSPEDRSITNRILVWKGALSMTADHWGKGVGADRFGEEFTAWYQPPTMKTSYLAALNNYLTLSAEAGIFALWFYLFLVAAVCWNAWRLATIHQHIFVISLICAEVVYLVSGLFTYSFNHWEVSWLFWLLFSILVVYLYSQRTGLRRKHFLIPPVATATIVCILVLVAGFYLLHEQPARTDFFTFENSGLHQEGVIIRPGKSDPHGVIVYLHDRGSTIREDGRDTLRYLAEKGYVVISVDYRDNGLDGLQDARAITTWVMKQKEFEQYPIFLTGFDLGGRLAILTACYDSFPRLKAVASIGSAAEWPFPEISPSGHLQNLSCPLLIVHGENDLENPISQAQLLKSLCARLSKPCELYIVKNENHFLGNEWPLALNRISDFFLQHRK